LTQQPDNHKPGQSATSRSSRIHESTANTYNLELRDAHDAGGDDVFTFTGQRITPNKSYVLLFDQTTQTATLEPLSSTYTFNLASKNGKDMSSAHDKIYPKKAHKDSVHDRQDDVDLFGEQPGDNDTADPDPNNPYDFRHFLSKEKNKTADDSEHGFVSSPEYRTGAGSASDTPQRKPVAPKPKPTETAAKKRKTDPMVKRPVARKPAPAPTVRLDRRATDRPADTPKAKTKTTQPPASKIKSAEIVHSSDDSDIEQEDKASLNSPARHRTPTPPHHSHHAFNSDEDGEVDDDSDGGLEIEVPDARPPRPRHTLGLGQNLGAAFLKSPSAGPRSLASAANSVDGSPVPGRNRHTVDDGVIDFGELGGDDDEEGEYGDVEVEGEDDGDVDVEPMNIGPPARQDSRKVSTGGGAAEEDEDDPLYKEMMEGLAGGDSSEESEEE
jgi:hypothetical protein